MKAVFFLLFFFSSVLALGEDSTAIAFWDDYDPREHALEVEVVREWDDEEGRYQLIRYQLGSLSGTNKSASPVIAAYWGVPHGASSSEKVPGIVHIHGGGQRAHSGRVADWVKLGFACVSINWGGKELEPGGLPNTDWDGLAAGFERPGASKAEELLHHNQVDPGLNTLFREPHLLNSSWNLIAMSARRALTFLESRSEVDGERLGVEGHSMGGRATVLTSIDPRVRAASPSVGGSGFLYRDMWGLPGSARRLPEGSNVDLYQQAVSCQSYWPHIEAPVLFLQATNDFNAPTDLVVEGMALLPDSTSRMLTMAPHLNHRFTTDTAAARFRWMQVHLMGNGSFPGVSASELILDTPDNVPVFRVRADASAGLPIEKVEIYYGYARDPRIRFWRSAEVRDEGDGLYSGACPVFDSSEPLFAFANLTYRIPDMLPARPGVAATDFLTVSSEYQSAYPETLQAAGVRETNSMHREIEDFSRAWQDWYRLSADNRHHWFYGTRKVIDPAWIGPKGGSLEVELETTEPGNRLAVGIEANTWQGYTGRPRDTFHAIVELPDSGISVISLAAEDFRNGNNQPMRDWNEATELTFTPANKVEGSDNHWRGQPLRLKHIRWVGGKQIPRPYPHEARGGNGSEPGTFENEFRDAIDESVKREQMDEKK